ncbi:MAG: cell division protein FtsQ/DivIB [Rickettsiales bacterium]|nr:cell division protein FtsQ/DivIB [Rickettsiales bacterium]
MTRKLKARFKDFILTNNLIRSVRLFFNKIFSALVFRFWLAILIFFLSALSALYYFKPNYFVKPIDKAIYYFYHYLKIDSRNFSRINITGINHIKKQEIIDIIEKTQGDLSKEGQKIISILAKNIKDALIWVDNIKITRNLPYTLNIEIEEFKPFAIWQEEGKKYFTNKGGKLVAYEEIDEYKYMFILSGHGANHNVESLFNIFFKDPELSANVYSANWVSNRRWDIVFEDGFLVKLPEKNVDIAWKKLKKILTMQGSTIGLKVIDLRVIDKIYLEYEDKYIKDLKN